jgi:hypothetical protein
MLKLIPKVLLLVALLATLVVSNVPVFAGPPRCTCVKGDRIIGPGCHFDQRTLQCVNTACGGSCY